MGGSVWRRHPSYRDGLRRGRTAHYDSGRASTEETPDVIKTIRRMAEVTKHQNPCTSGGFTRVSADRIELESFVVVHLSVVVTCHYRGQRIKPSSSVSPPVSWHARSSNDKSLRRDQNPIQPTRDGASQA